jgi:hypothetical protein
MLLPTWQNSMLPAKITVDQSSDSQPMVNNLICFGLQMLPKISDIKYTFLSATEQIAAVNKTANNFHNLLYFPSVYFDLKHDS